MKNFNTYIVEAKASEKGRKKKPSGLYKSQTQARKVMNTYIDSDIYDLSDKGSKKEDTYYDRYYWGFIMDKEGNIYNVTATAVQGDAGRIAGGLTDYYIKIQYNNKLTISLSGYTGVFSHGEGHLLIGHLEAGHYLEDYLAMHKQDIDNRGEENKPIQELISNGDENAVSYEKDRSDKKKMKEAEFDSRYIDCKYLYTLFEVKDGKVVFEKLRDQYKELEPVFTEFVENALENTFTNISLSDLNGVEGHLEFLGEGTGYSENYKRTPYVAYDTKKKNLVYIDYQGKNEKRVVLDKPVEYTIDGTLKVYVYRATDTFKKWLETAYDAFIKNKRHEHATWVNNRADQILREKYWSISKKTAKNMAEQEWQGILDSNNPKSQAKSAIFLPLDYIALGNSKIKPKAKVKAETPDTTPNELPSIEDNLDNKPKETGEQPDLPKGSEDAIEKMKKWHSGERGFNVRAASPAKLKLNYKVCKHLGYEEEMKKIEDVAKEKGIVLESRFSINDIIELKESMGLIIPRKIQDNCKIDIKQEIKDKEIQKILLKYFGDTACALLKNNSDNRNNEYNEILNYFIDNGKIINKHKTSSNVITVYSIDDNILVSTESKDDHYGANEIFWSDDLTFID